MRIPSQLLRTRALVADYQGDTGATGPSWGAPRTVRCRFDSRRRVVRTATGEDVVSSAALVIRPEETIAVQSKVTVLGHDYTVLDEAPVEGLTRPAFREVILGG